MKIIKEELNQISFIVPKCDKCDDKYMDGFFFKFYKDPSFGTTESMASFFWTEMWFQCKYCWAKKHLTDLELDKLNSYPIDMINWPPGFNTKNMKVQRLTSK
jgi:hypothetical protein